MLGFVSTPPGQKTPAGRRLHGMARAASRSGRAPSQSVRCIRPMRGGFRLAIRRPRHLSVRFAGDTGQRGWAESLRYPCKGESPRLCRTGRPTILRHDHVSADHNRLGRRAIPRSRVEGHETMAWGAHMTARYTVRPTGTREEHAVYRVHDERGYGWKETLCYGETFAHAMFISEIGRAS